MLLSLQRLPPHSTPYSTSTPSQSHLLIHCGQPSLRPLAHLSIAFQALTRASSGPAGSTSPAPGQPLGRLSSCCRPHSRDHPTWSAVLDVYSHNS
mmetsp:Transcript_16664/g.29767  ORF Transcript_16664/g.29767 Transcript_16664/m.29767 type:complete len:95 (-) Transcript_16664:103-387(-)